MGQLKLIDLDVENRKIILADVTDVDTDDEFAQEEEVTFSGRGVVREVRVRTKDDTTTVKNVIACTEIKFKRTKG